MRRLISAVVLIALLAFGSSAWAALQEKPVLDEINNNVAVLRYLHRQISQIEQDLELVRAARDLTQKQLEAQKALVQSETTKGNKERAALFQNNLTRLQRHMDKLGEFDFEKVFGQRIEKLRKDIEKYTMDLETRMTEYAVLFGKKPSVDVDFRKDIERGRARRVDAANFLDLN